MVQGPHPVQDTDPALPAGVGQVPEASWSQGDFGVGMCCSVQGRVSGSWAGQPRNPVL